mmetsp:Transcript_28702/g.66837  ORF Transcript_28702/g.66837 Transcript_28702/m.66837 type:complete len:109 (+) Transcript_28702:901-1227(+)
MNSSQSRLKATAFLAIDHLPSQIWVHDSYYLEPHNIMLFSFKRENSSRERKESTNVRIQSVNWTKTFHPFLKESQPPRHCVLPWDFGPNRSQRRPKWRLLAPLLSASQ